MIQTLFSIQIRAGNININNIRNDCRKKESGRVCPEKEPDYCISEDEIICIHFMDDFFLKKYAYKLLDEKIGVESRFAYLFYEITKNLYLKYRMQEIGGFTEKEEIGIWNFLGRKEARDEGDTVIKVTSLKLSKLHMMKVLQKVSME